MSNGTYTPRPSTSSTGSSTVGRKREVKKQYYSLCDHNGNPKKKAITDEQANKKRRTVSKPSIKVGYRAEITIKELLSGLFEVVYDRQHNGHDPTDIRDVIKSTLPPEARASIERHVEQNMDWKATKRLLRLTPEQMDIVSHIVYIGESTCRRLSTLIDRTKNGAITCCIAYQIYSNDVQNFIQARLNKLSRKATIDKASVQAWLQQFLEEGYDILESIGAINENTFVIAWVSPGQKTVSNK